MFLYVGNSINDATPYAVKVPTAEPNIFIDGIPVSVIT